MPGPSILHPLTGVLRCAGCGHGGTRLCSRCGRLRPGDRGTLLWAWPYERGPRTLVLAAKVRGDRAAADALAAGVWRAWVRAGHPVDAVTWVPGRPHDISRRGFDHAHAIAMGVSARSGAPLTRLVTRRRVNDDQAGLGVAARRANLLGVFEARAAPPRCLVVDDVITTGATARACMAALRGGGARAVTIAAACGPRPGHGDR